MTFRPLLLAATILAPAALVAPVSASADTINGLYIGGLAGANFEQDINVNRIRVGNTAVNLGNTVERLDTGYRTGAYIGYGLGNGVRIELEGDFFDNSFSRVGQLFNSNGFTNGTFIPSATKINGDRQKYGRLPERPL